MNRQGNQLGTQDQNSVVGTSNKQTNKQQTSVALFLSRSGNACVVHRMSFLCGTGHPRVSLAIFENLQREASFPLSFCSKGLYSLFVTDIAAIMGT